MCSVLQRPIPSAPKFLAVLASWGVSAFALIPSLRHPSAQDMRVLNSSVNSGGIVGTLSSMTLPVDPSRVMRSPCFTTLSPTLRRALSSSTYTASQPTTQGFPMPLATIAACDVIPPVEVRIPILAAIPCMSSGEVSALTRMTLFSSPISLASSAWKTTIPLAAPGEAGNPDAMTTGSALGSIVGWRSCSTDAGSTRRRACF